MAQQRRKKKLTKSQKLVREAMREVHNNIPSTVRRARNFGPGGREAMLRRIALEKARKRGARIPKRRRRKA